MKPRLLMMLHYLGGAGLLPSVAQPPLPLHEFFPLQPLSPVLQPPLPLQELLPLQECLSDFFPICSETPGFPVETLAWVVAANEPLISPAIAAPATIAFFVIGTFLFFCSPSQRHQAAGSRSNCRRIPLLNPATRFNYPSTLRKGSRNCKTVDRRNVRPWTTATVTRWYLALTDRFSQGLTSYPADSEHPRQPG
jgi:hypothetical protein